MKNNKKNLWPLAVTIVFLLYLLAAPVAMAAPEAPVNRNTTQDAEATVSQNTVQDIEPDKVSTANEFTAWLESHKNSGGSVKLTNNIVLKEFYFFAPNGANLPDIIVDTDIYTITAAGNIRFLSDGHLVFRGKANSEGIFHVMKGSMLTLDGVIVEGVAEGTLPQYTLWQEEGAGLLLGNTYLKCTVSGEVHYADMPFVTESASACVVVEKGQSVDGLYPTQIRCNVNYQGQMLYNEQTPVSWDIAGTEEQRERRQRFRVQGFSSQAVFEVPPICTVVYNDYPLTFTEVDAFMRGKVYYFQGGYTKPQGAFPLVVTAEYSFDGTSWIENEERTVSGDKEGFCICLSGDQWDTEENPYIYIRLRAIKDDKTYLSNVLRYKAYNMNVAEDLGGGRGDGTSIVNPPDEPKNEDSNATSSDNRKPSESQKPSDVHKLSQDAESEKQTDLGSDHEISDAASDIDPSVSLNNNVSGNVDESNISTTDIPENPNDEDIASHMESALTENMNKGKGSYSATANIDGNHNSDADEADAETAAKGTVEVVSKELMVSASEGRDENVSKRQQMTINQRLNTTQNIVFVLGLVTLLAGVGVAGYFVHTSSLRRHKQRKTVSKRGRHQKGKTS